MILHGSIEFNEHPFELEADLEDAIQEVKARLFGASRIYLEIKRKIGKKGAKQNIPDAYIIDLSSSKAPKLFVVENELSRHDHLKHIAVQILEFSLAFEINPQRVKEVIREALKKDSAAEKLAAEYAKKNQFENVDYLLDRIVHRKEAFNALVIIDELKPELENVLREKFKFPVETLTLERFQSSDGEIAYKFEPFGKDVDASNLGSELPPLDPAELDTVVVPAQREGFLDTFLDEDRWYQIRMSSGMIPQVNWVAAYEVAPISAITHLAKVDEIKPYKDTGKYELVFDGPAKKLDKPIKLVPKSKIKGLQSPRYTSVERLQKAKNLNEAF